MKKNIIRSLYRSILILTIIEFNLTSCGKLSSFDQMAKKYQSLKEQKESLVESNEAGETMKQAEEGSSLSFDFILPENIEITFLGENIFIRNYDRWQFCLYEQGAGHNTELIVDDSYLFGYQYQTHPGYVVKRIEKGQVYTGEGSDVARIEFGEEGLLYSISVFDRGTSIFSISGLQVGENAKDYLNGMKDGLWSQYEKMGRHEFLKGEDGWTLTHGTFSYGDEFYDQLSFTNELFGITYNLENEVVHHINLYKRDNADEALLALLEAPSILDINPDRYQLLVDDMDLYTSLPMDWVNHFGLDYVQRKMMDSEYGYWTYYSCDGLVVTLDGDEFHSNAELSMGGTYVLRIYDSSNAKIKEDGRGFLVEYDDEEDHIYCEVIVQMPYSEYVDSITRTVTIHQNLPYCDRLKANHLLPDDDLKTYFDYLEPGLYGRLVKKSYQIEEKDYVQIIGADIGDEYQISLWIDEEKRTLKKFYGTSVISYNLYDRNNDQGIIKEICIKREGIEKVADFQ